MIDRRAPSLFEFLTIVVMTICGSMTSFAALDLPSEIRFLLETTNSLEDQKSRTVSRQQFQALLSEEAFLNEIYRVGDFNPLWADQDKRKTLITLIGDAHKDGLDAEDYHFSRLNQIMPAAQLDILLTDAFARFAYHLRFGKANPLEIDKNWNFSRELITDNPALWIRDAIADNNIIGALQWLRPKIPHYTTLKSGLTRYREFANEGEWQRIAEGPTLKIGMENPRVSQLRTRLTQEDYLLGTAVENANYFDRQLEQSVIAYQRHQGLFEDGFVGQKTLAALNVPVSARIDQVRVNLERIRWLFRDLEDEYIAVNIAEFKADYVRLGKIKWSARAVVGRPYRQTPSFKATLTHMIINPTWTVPPTILREDILPAMAKNTDYLSRKGLQVFDRNGVPVDSTTINWQQAAENRFPYYIKQGPGVNNALGRIKFMFPNPHLIYLHDTPSRTLFERAERTFSSGCIRIEHPFQLATTLLNRTENWFPKDIEELIASGQPRRVDLDRPITVMMLYLTAFAAHDGALAFRRDIYKRDQPVLSALNGPFRFVPPTGY